MVAPSGIFYPFPFPFPGQTPFNRAMLMNIGAAEALRQDAFQCFIFHDVDLIPEDDRNIYSCPEQPRHMSVAIDVFKYQYYHIFQKIKCFEFSLHLFFFL